MEKETDIRRKELIRSAAGGVCLAVIYVSSIYFIAAIGYKSEIAAVIFAVVMAAVYFVTLISPNKKYWLLKYLLSIPLSFGVLMYFRLTGYAVRALNWAYPGYGNLSAGGRFAGSIQLLSFSGLCMFAVLISLFIRTRKGGVFEKIRDIVSLSITVLIVISVILFETQLPDKILAGCLISPFV